MNRMPVQNLLEFKEIRVILLLCGWWLDTLYIVQLKNLFWDVSDIFWEIPSDMEWPHVTFTNTIHWWDTDLLCMGQRCSYGLLWTLLCVQFDCKDCNQKTQKYNFHEKNHWWHYFPNLNSASFQLSYTFVAL